ncbi:MAG: permease [Armatimonadota bacterium]
MVWIFLYRYIPDMASWLVFDLLKLEHGSHLGEAVFFFLYEVPKVLMLLLIVVFAVGIIRSFFTVETTRSILAGKFKFTGNIIAALLGVVTPFCSCSAVPLFIGFVEAGVPLGVTFSFLVSAPMVNEVALVLLFGLIGWKVALLYMITGLLIAIFSGIIIGYLRLENLVEDWVYNIKMGQTNISGGPATWPDRLNFALQSVKEIVGRVWLYVVIGIAIGAGIHGYVPEGFMAVILGKSAWWSVPAAVLVGIPMYSNAAGIVPVVKALLEKGAALGSVLAFMMAVIALSLPEAIILRKVLKPRLIAIFFGIIAAGILLVGYLFNLIF